MKIDTDNVVTYADEPTIRHYNGRSSYEMRLSRDWCEKNGVEHGDVLKLHQVPGHPHLLLLELVGTDGKPV